MESRIENRRPYLFHPEGSTVTAMSQSSVLSCGSFLPSFDWLWFLRINSEVSHRSPVASLTHLWQIWNDNFSVFVCLFVILCETLLVLYSILPILYLHCPFALYMGMCVLMPCVTCKCFCISCKNMQTLHVFDLTFWCLFFHVFVYVWAHIL